MVRYAPLKESDNILNQNTEDKGSTQIYKLHIRVKGACHMKMKDKDVKPPIHPLQKG